MQQVIVILLVGACAVWLARYVYRFLMPKAGKSCGGNCCSQGNSESSQARPSAGKKSTVMISSDALRARVQARKG